VATEAARPRRPKHAPHESEREILDAAERLLRERPFREVTVGRIMDATGLKRPAFYVHFRDRGDVVVRILQGVTQELLDAAGAWLADEGDPGRDMLGALEATAAVYAGHGPLLRALADASVADAQTESAYRGAVEGIAEAVARRIRRGQADGTISQRLDARETARALVWMNERYLYETLGREPPNDLAQVVAVLNGIWVATL
jgi:AcrR family transcriptional regulator